LPKLGSEELLRKRIKRAFDNDKEGVKNSNDIDLLLREFPNTLLHEACRAKCDKDIVQKLIRNVNQSMLKHKDELGWLPLHYACRHCHDGDGKSDIELISFLIQLYPKAVTTPDKFNKCPLHIAVDSRASVGVIDLLIKKDDKNEAIKRSTTSLNRSPLHIACHRGVSKEVFEILLNVDSAEVLESETDLGCTPLQLAIESRVHHDVIKTLVAKSDKIVHSDDVIEVLDIDEEKKYGTIHKRYNGMVSLMKLKCPCFHC
jgi:ankyrin repeat protein